ncbi:MAG TPA: VOC family protein [Acidimicrobiales bacterium]
MIDHLVYGAPDLGAAVDDLERRLGVRVAPGGRHAGVGTHNALVALGPTTYLEVIAPDPDQPPPPRPRPFGLDGLRAPGLVGWAVGCDDVDAAVARARAAGHDPGDPVEMTRTTPAGAVLRWRLTANARGGGPVPFLIDWGTTPHPASSAPPGLTLADLTVEHPDPEGLAAVLRALGAVVTVTAAPVAALVARVDGPSGSTLLR